MIFCRRSRSLYMRNIILALFSIVLLLACAIRAHAQFVAVPLAETNGTVAAMARLGSALYVGGSFSYVGRHNGSFAGVDMATGRILDRFPLIEGFVVAQIPDGQGGVYIGGSFARVGNAACRNVAHIMADGRVDLDWKVSTDNSVYALCLYDSKVYIGGSFGTINGQSRKCLAAVDAATGALDSWMVAGTPTYVHALAISGGRVYIGGYWDYLGNPGNANFTVADSASGNTVPLGIGAGGVVRKLRIIGSKLYIIGDFAGIGSKTRNGIAELDMAAGQITEWNPGISGSYYDVAEVGSKLYVFASVSIGGKTINVATAGADGSLTPIDCGLNQFVQSVAVDGKTIYISAYGNECSIKALDTETDRLTSWTLEAKDSIYSTVVSGETLFLGGANHNSMGGCRRPGIAAIDSITGNVLDWKPFGLAGATKLALGDNQLLVSSWFKHAGSTKFECVASIDLASGGLNPWWPGVTAAPSDIMTSGSMVYMAGRFDFGGGNNTTNRVAAMSDTDSSTPIWNVNADAEIYCLATDGSKLFAGGGFKTIGGNAHAGIAAIDPHTGVIYPWNPGLRGVPNFYSVPQITAMAAVGSTLYVGGAFCSDSDTSCRFMGAIDIPSASLLAWNPNPEVAPYPTLRTGNFMPGLIKTDEYNIPRFSTIASKGSTLYVAGSFIKMLGKSRVNVAAFDLPSGALNGRLFPADNCQSRLFGENEIFAGLAGSIIRYDFKRNLEAKAWALY